MPEFSERIFFVLATILIIASGLGIITTLFSQPLILAYILSGALVGFLSSNFVMIPTPTETFGFFSQIGIALILFMVGIELSFSDIKSIGKPVFLATTIHAFLLGTLAFILAILFHFNGLVSFYIAMAIIFSSTVIVVKLLGEQRETNSLYGKITIGILLLQDLAAVVILMILTGIGHAGSAFDWRMLALTIVKGVALVLILWGLSKFVLKRIFQYVASNLELLFLCAIAWALGVASLWKFSGFSFEIGAFLAGVALASLPYRHSISGRIAPIRDFFIIIFFIVLGLSIDFEAIKSMFWAIVAFSLFVLIVTPVVVANTLGYLGFGKRVSFLTGLSLAQVSEFSLILVILGKSLGHLDGGIVSFISSVAIVTIAGSSYLIINGSKIYRLIGVRLKLIERQKMADEEIHKKDLENHLILVGCEQMGSDILKFLQNKSDDKKEPLIVVDFNPQIVESLTAAGTKVIFGDISDPEILERLNLGRAKLIITTILDLVDNINLIKFAKGKGYKGPIICTSYWLHDAIRLYEAGCDYVVVPETIGGKHVSRILGECWENLKMIKEEKSKHFEELLSRKIF